MFWSFRRVGKESGVSFEEGRVGKETIIGVGGGVDSRLWFLPPDRGLVPEIIDVVRVISRDNDYEGLRCGGVGMGGRVGGEVKWRASRSARASENR